MRKTIWFFLSAILLLNVSIHSQESGLYKGQAPPLLSYYSLEKKETVVYNKEDFNGPVFLIDFWATWCSPCIESIPHLNKLVEKYKNKNVMFISITYEPEDIARKFLKAHPMKSDVGLDDDFKMFRKYNAWAIPNVVMINSNGKFAGRIHPENLTDEVIETLLNGGIPNVENTPEDAFDPAGAEEYFRSFLEKQEKD